MDYDDRNRGVLFLETNKESDKHPDYTGKINVEGKEFRLAGWKRQSKNGKGYLSLSVSELKPREESRESGYAKAKSQADSLRDESEPIDLSEIPF